MEGQGVPIRPLYFSQLGDDLISSPAIACCVGSLHLEHVLEGVLLAFEGLGTGSRGSQF